MTLSQLLLLLLSQCTSVLKKSPGVCATCVCVCAFFGRVRAVDEDPAGSIPGTKSPPPLSLSLVLEIVVETFPSQSPVRLLIPSNSPARLQSPRNVLIKEEEEDEDEEEKEEEERGWAMGRRAGDPYDCLAVHRGGEAINIDNVIGDNQSYDHPGVRESRG